LATTRCINRPDNQQNSTSALPVRVADFHCIFSVADLKKTQVEVIIALPTGTRQQERRGQFFEISFGKKQMTWRALFAF